MKFLPKFTTTLPSSLDATIAQEVTLTLTADDPKQQLVQVKVDRNLATSAYSLGTFWTVIQKMQWLSRILPTQK